MLKRRGYSCPYILYKTPANERGLWSDLNRITTSYNQWCATLAQHGVNLIRTRLSGDQRVGNANWGQYACGFEPPPVGTFNIWHSALDPADLDTYRAEQYDGGVLNPGHWQASNIHEFTEAAQRHGIKLLLIPFECREFRGAWRLHAWNATNCYTNWQPCEEQDRGFASSLRDVFEMPEAIAAAKSRISAMYGLLAPYDVIAAWEIMAEMTWIATDRLRWGETEDGWSNQHRANIREVLVPWVSEMAQHIKSLDPDIPVGNGQAWGGSTTGHGWPDDPDHIINVINELYTVPELDFVLTNWYIPHDLDGQVAWLRQCQDKFQRPVYIEQYAPWSGRTEPWTGEPPPHLYSRLREWASACGEYGTVGAIRWPGLSEERLNEWIDGGYEDPQMMSIAGVTSHFADAVDITNWNGRGESWDDLITGDELSRVVSWGDGRHVCALLTWDSDGAKQIAVDGIEGGQYQARVFDWVTGQPGDVVEVSDGALVVPSGQQNTAVVYLCPVTEEPPEPPPDPEPEPEPPGITEARVIELARQVACVETSTQITEAMRELARAIQESWPV